MMSLSALSSPSSFSTFIFPTRPHFRCRKPISAARSQTLPELDPALPAEVKTFWGWLAGEGVVSAKTPARPGVVEEGLGLVAQRDIARNEVVLEVPKRLWINPDTVEASEIGGVCAGLKPWISVALFLIREKSRDDSKWRLYIDVLPKTTNSTVFWWGLFI